ncbi:hypothetical protein B566_EDAN000835 [Ephemera danica]|nr:hypothetical protein B566_EDAN000835 [Ephemera danica]
MKQACVTGKKITTTDTGIAFNKFRTKNMDFDTFCAYLQEFKQKMPRALAVGGVDRLTDTTQYTGAHRQRFDATGRGRGREGREDDHKNTGYVAAYKQKDTYDKTH